MGLTSLRRVRPDVSFFSERSQLGAASAAGTDDTEILLEGAIAGIGMCIWLVGLFPVLCKMAV